jgi:hypothetical protein
MPRALQKQHRIRKSQLSGYLLRSRGLEWEVEIQVVRKSPLQTTEFDLKEENETAKKFFNSLERILERRMLKKTGEK